MASWHSLSLFPFITIVLAVFILNLQRYTKPVVVLIFAYYLFLNVVYLNSYSQPTRSAAWSSTIYQLVEVTKKQDGQFICLDVDICNQLTTLTQQSGKYKEIPGYLDPGTYPKTFANLSHDFNLPDKKLYITHGETTTHLPNLKQIFFEFAKSKGFKLSKIYELSDSEKTIFEIYRVDSLGKGI